MIGGLVSWIGALLNTSQLDSKTWFLALLLLGIFNFGFFAMIAYVIVGPDGTAPWPPRRQRACADRRLTHRRPSLARPTSLTRTSGVRTVQRETTMTATSR